MTAYYKINPPKRIKILFILGILLIIVAVVIKTYIPERIDRNFHKKVKTLQGIYVGELEFGSVDGDGKFTWNNEDFYVGEFSDNEINGKGKLTLADGGYYIGNFKAGVRDGLGEFKWANGNVYTGDWSNDKLAGEGTLNYTNGDKLEGFFKNGRFISGVYSTKRASATYKITFEEGKVTHVNIKYMNGTIYDGEYRKNAYNGEGKLIYQNGDEYIGEFKGGKKEGHGTYTWKNGASYVGDWENDKMEGQGAYYYPNNSNAYKLEGKFRCNRPDGKLDYYVSITKSYETKWKNGKCVKLTE